MIPFSSVYVELLAIVKQGYNECQEVYFVTSSTTLNDFSVTFIPLRRVSIYSIVQSYFLSVRIILPQ